LAAAPFLPKAGEIADQHPELRITIDRLAVPCEGGGLSEPAQPLALAKHPNVAEKATGLFRA